MKKFLWFSVFLILASALLTLTNSGKLVDAKSNAPMKTEEAIVTRDSAKLEGAVFMQEQNANSPLRFEVTVAKGLLEKPHNGRLFVIVSPHPQGEPRLTVGNTGFDSPPTFARDLNNFSAGSTGVIDNSAAAFPIAGLSELPPREYSIQALFDSNIDLKSAN